MVGQTISHHHITSKLGEGGMGVVNKADDTNLRRPVALKFLAAHLLGDEDVKARFRREAEAAAALHHPNLCAVHEIAEANGRTSIAMAFLEGEGLDKKIEAGPLRLKDALLPTARSLPAWMRPWGTVTYLSPEQTYGMEPDHRTDIWFLGVVIYEMVTGQQPFKGHYDKAVMYSMTNSGVRVSGHWPFASG